MVLQHGAVRATSSGAKVRHASLHGEPVIGDVESGRGPMGVRAIGTACAARQPLSEGEKAMLFDLAMEAGGFRGGREVSRTEALAAAPLILAFARAYVTIRDREDGIV